MGGGDLNSKKAWHPNTMKNQERVWKAEQAAAEEKKRIVELERERHLERERAELNKLAKSSHSGLAGDDRLHWMYEKPDKKVQHEEYLLGKAIKNHEHEGKSEADEIPAVSRRVVGSSMLSVPGDGQVDLARKLREDPLLLVKERERAARAALLNNPVQRARLTELLRKEKESKIESKSKQEKKKGKELDNILAEKLQALSGKKGIDLASLLATDDSSSESSDVKSKKKKKKKEKKNKSKNVMKHNDELENQSHNSQDSTRNESKRLNNSHNRKRATSESEEDIHTKRKKGYHSINKSHAKERPRDTSVDSSDDQRGRDELPKTNVKEDRYWNTKSKKSYHSINKSHAKERRRDTSVDSSDDQRGRDELPKTNVKEDRYWNDKQYMSNYRQSREQPSREKTKSKDDDSHVRDERHSKTGEHSRDERHRHERQNRHVEVSSSRSYKDLQNDHKNERDKGQFGNASSSSDNHWRSKKSSGLSEEAKAAKLAEMVAAGAEREKQRGRRVAHQLAQKQTEERTAGTFARSRNSVHPLPDSLESRLHSNRHYIQRDQRHMNENFAKR